MANERLFGRACKTCRRRGRKCDRRMPSCNTCETSGQTCEGYLLQWPGLASRGQFVGKSIPVAGMTKRRQTRRAQQPTVPTVAPPTLPQSPQSPANNNDRAEAQKNRFDDPIDPMALFLELDNVNTAPDPLIWSNDVSFMADFSDGLAEPEPDANIEPPFQDHSKEPPSILAFRHILGPSLDILSIPDELKFIMQYRQC
ncbi:hypothetical protein N7490_011787 [Penicillium lividum]|nr:hypothetical protein N7490_011787 [Penicillium lividum]